MCSCGGDMGLFAGVPSTPEFHERGCDALDPFTEEEEITTTPSGQVTAEDIARWYGDGADDYPRGIPIMRDSKAECLHTFKFYQGLSEKFNYCTKCDKKEMIDVN